MLDSQGFTCGEAPTSLPGRHTWNVSETTSGARGQGATAQVTMVGFAGPKVTKVNVLLLDGRTRSVPLATFALDGQVIRTFAYANVGHGDLPRSMTAVGPDGQTLAIERLDLHAGPCAPAGCSTEAAG